MLCCCNLMSSKAGPLVFLFSFFGATAFDCTRQGQTGKIRTKSVPSSSALLTYRSQHQDEQEYFSRSSNRFSELTSKVWVDDSQGSKKTRRCRCPDDEIGDDDNEEKESLEDRREALFAAMGGLWAVATTASTSAALVGLPEPSAATAGVDANMAFPDVMAGMNDRATKQCLVESLGNRECLVYKETDPDKLLYKEANVEILVERTKKAASALGSIPPLVEKKRWNEVQGILTGPMGELSSTLTLLCGDDASKTKLARKVKEDLFAMGTATTQRREDVILKYHEAATKDLAKFLESAL